MKSLWRCWQVNYLDLEEIELSTRSPKIWICRNTYWGVVVGLGSLVLLRNSMRLLRNIPLSFNQIHILLVPPLSSSINIDSNDAFDILGEVIVKVYGMTPHKFRLMKVEIERSKKSCQMILYLPWV
jgi:hypothetical protein